jgi:threonine/homoserine/homoserine lactone efflux protein
MHFEFLVQGTIVGFLIAIPVGPVNVLCLRRALADGWATGFVSGLGAAVADAAYGGVAAFGLTLISDLLLRHAVPIRLVGGALLVLLGAKTWRADPRIALAVERSPSFLGAFASTLFLTLTNPLTILSFGAIFAGLQTGGRQAEEVDASLLVAGVFLGSTAWWAVLSSIAGHFRERLGVKALRWVNRTAGLAVGGFGIWAIVSAFL